MRTMERRGGLVLVILLSVSMIGPAATVSGPIGNAAAAEGDVQIIDMDVPEEMKPGEEYDTSVTLRNMGDSAAQVRVEYRFEDQRVMATDQIIAAGETKRAMLQVSVSDIGTSKREKLYDGEYQHGYQVGNARAQQNVIITGLGTPTPTRTPISQETVSGGEAESSGEGPINVLAVDAPEELRRGEERTLALQIENSADRPMDLDVIYFLDDAPTTGTPTSIGAGERKTVTFPISIERLRSSYDAGSLGPGTYNWHILAGEARVGGEITLGSGSGSGSGEFSDGDAAPNSGPDGDQPRRGFFSNGEPEVAFLDSFTLTVGGFILSAMGIFHQMLNG